MHGYLALTHTHTYIPSTVRDRVRGTVVSLVLLVGPPVSPVHGRPRNRLAAGHGLAGLGRAVMARDISHVSGPVWSHALSSGSLGATEYSALDLSACRSHRTGEVKTLAE